MFNVGKIGAYETPHSPEKFRKNFRRFLDDERGATMVEYGLMVALLTVIMISTLTSMGNNVAGTFADADTGFK